MKLKSLFIFFYVIAFSQIVSQNAVYEWAKAIGTNTASGAGGVCVKIDAAGSTFITGYFRGALDVDPSAGVFNITSYLGSTDFFIAKYNNAGALQWAKSIGGSQTESCNSIAIDNAGNILLTGSFQGTVDFDPGASVVSFSTSGTDVFLEKLDALGNFIWAFTLTNTSSKNSYAVTTDQNSNVIITGFYSGLVDFDPGAGVTSFSPITNSDFFIAKYDPNGNYIWAKVAQNIGSSKGKALICDNNNNIFIGGEFSGKVDFNPSASVDTLSSFAGVADIFFGKYDSFGNFVFVKHATGGSIDELNGLTLDVNKNILITGNLQGAGVDFDPSVAVVVPPTSNSSNTIFIAKYDSLGNYSWVITVGSNVGTNDSKSIITDAVGNVYTTGFFQGTADFDASAVLANLTAIGTTDIFMSKYDPSGNYIWTKKIGSNFSNKGASIALHPSGNIASTGSFYSITDFDPSPATYNLSSSVFNAYFRYTFFVGYYAQSTGGFSSAFAPTDYQYGDESSNSIKKDQVGNIYICGAFNGSVDFDPSPVTDYYMTSAGYADGFVAKYAPTGALLWARKIGGLKSDGCKAIAIDNLGNCIVTGNFDSTATFNPAFTATLSSSGGYEDAFLMKLNPVGFLLWHTGFGSTGNDSGTALATDNLNNIYVSGYFEGTVDTDPSTGTNILFSSGTKDIFFSQFSSIGNFIWGGKIGSTTDDLPHSMVIDNSGDLVMIGGFSGTADFDPNPSIAILNCSGNYDIFLAKYNSSGAYIFANKIGSTGADNGKSVCVDASNNYIISGDFQGTVDFNPANFATFNLTSNGPYDAFVAKYDSNGNYIWVRHISGNFGQLAEEVVTDVNSNVYVTGSFGASTNFGGISLNNIGILDQFISKYDANGNNLWVSNVGGTNRNYGLSLVVDNNDNIYGTGYFSEISDFDPTLLTANKVAAGGLDIFILKYKQCVNVIASVSSQSNVSCNGGNNGFINLLASGGSGFTYSWTPSGATTSLITGLSAGSYSCLIMNSCGSANSINIIVTQPSSLNLNINITPTLICQGANVAMQALVNGGTPTYSYSWSNSAILSAISFTPTSSGNYNCVVTDAQGCIKTATAAFVVNNNPTITIIASNSTLCAGSSVTLSAAGANTYSWNSIASPPNLVVSPSVTSVYSVLGKNIIGCTDTETLSLIVNPLPILNFQTSPNPICVGNSATLTVNGASTYTWSTGSNSNMLFVSPPITSYSVTGIDVNGCISTLLVAPVINPNPILNVTSTAPIICTGSSATITAFGALTYTWNNGNNNNSIIITPTLNTSYTVTGSSTAGCIDSTIYTQNVSICTNLEEILEKSNSFITIYPNPNNGQFYISEFENNIGKEVDVYNSLGQLIKQLKIESNIQSININEYPNGFYFVKVKEGDIILNISKIIKN